MNFFLYLHENINIPLLQFLNGLMSCKLMEKMVYLMSDIPIFILPIFLLSFWIYFRFKKNNLGKEKLLFIFYSIVFAIVINIFVQQFVILDRPEESLKATGKIILNHIPDASFPSDHASVSIAFLTSLFLFGFGKIAFLVFPFFAVMLLSRIIGGIHWPFDILVGCFIGVSSAFLIYKFKNINILKKMNSFFIKIASYIKL